MKSIILGGLLLLKYRWMILLHIPAAIWGALIEFNSWLCPLTLWENHFRISANQAGYQDGFIEHYLIPIIYPSAVTVNIQLVLGSLVVFINLLIYVYVIRKLYKSIRKEE